ncbi:molybdenum cofactor guanylyltransferase MobA [Pseudopelagicola sp. nBUS_19]|uniref:molybdenum cofactor guanylyltransferase MobA n=1 Tax=Pseudopelagicola sp. nBUS_19 TaxID=3395316 RepID=UPI003EBA3920
MKKPLGVILAGGQATRMGGGDKGLIKLGEQTILSRVIERLEPQVANLALNANGDKKRFANFGLPVLPDDVEGHAGPLAGVLAGLDWAAQLGWTTIVTVAADTPFFPCDLVPRLLEATEGMEHRLALAAAPRKAGEFTKSMSRSGLIRHPTFGIWPVALRNNLRTALTGGLRKVVLWTDPNGGRLVNFDEVENPFFNVNTPEDLEIAKFMVNGS